MIKLKSFTLKIDAIGFSETMKKLVPHGVVLGFSETIKNWRYSVSY